MLAKNTSNARGHDPACQRWTTPEKMVSVCSSNSVRVSVIGRTFAGMYRMNAAK